MLLLSMGIAGWEGTEAANALAVAGLSLFASVQLWRRVGSDIPFAELAVFLAVLQWILFPFIAFNFPPYQATSYAMSGTQEQYFRFTLPATIAFAIGTILAKRWLPSGGRMPHTVLPQQYPLIYGFMLIAMAAAVVGPYLPSSLAFIAKIVSDLQIVGCVMLVCSRHPLRIPLVIGMLAFAAVSSQSRGMFHELILWCAVFSLYAFNHYGAQLGRATLATAKAATAVGGIAAIFVLQLVKAEFREQLRRAEPVSIVALGANRLSSEGSPYSSSELAAVLVRFNQGWIISRIMNHIPAYRPYFDGQTYVSSVQTIFMPRVLFPSRPVIDLSETFGQFTGIYLNKSTTMGISLLGEAYGNFGPRWGVAAMVVVGVVLSASVQFVKRAAVHVPLLFFLASVIFTEPLKAETDTTMVLNYIVKATVIAFAIAYVLTRFCPMESTDDQASPALGISRQW